MALNHNRDKGWAQLHLQGFVGLSSLSNSGAHVTLCQWNYKVWEWVLGLRIFYSAQRFNVQPSLELRHKPYTLHLRRHQTRSASRSSLPSYCPSLCFPVLPAWINPASPVFILILQVSDWVWPARGTFTSRSAVPPWKHALSHTTPSKPLQFHLPHYYKDRELLEKCVLLIFGPLTQCWTHNRY